MEYKSTPILDAIKAEIFGGSVGEKAVIKPSPGGHSNGRKINYDVAQRDILADPDLGKITDLEMSKKYGVSRGYAGRLRKDAGFKPVSAPKGVKVSALRERVLANPNFGKCRDSDLARECNTTEDYIRKMRQNLGIPVCSDRIPDWRNDLIKDWKVDLVRMGKTRSQWKRYVQESLG